MRRPRESDGAYRRIDSSFLAASRLNAPLQVVADNTNEEKKSGFQNILDDLMEASNEASAASRANTARLLTGTMEDFPEFMVTGEKSSIMFELNLTVRNKVIDAYQEVLKTQI